MDLKILETYMCVAESKSFSEAASKLYLSTSAVVKQMNILETEVGQKLFLRTPNGCSLTKIGTSFLEDTKDIISQFNIALAHTKNLSLENKNELYIAIPLDMSPELVLQAKTIIEKACKNYTITYRAYGLGMENAKELKNNLGTINDFVLTIYDEKRINDANLQAIKLLYSNIKCFIPYGHHLYNNNSIALSDLKNNTVMMIERGAYQAYDIIRREMMILGDIEIEDIDKNEAYTTTISNCINLQKIYISSGVAELPLIKQISLEEYVIPFGLMYSNYSFNDLKDIIHNFNKSMYK